MKNLGENLKKARIRSGFTQKQVESALGLRELALKDYETERIKLPAEMAMKLASLFHMSVEELLSGTYQSIYKINQPQKLLQVEMLFTKGDTNFMFLDPVIRAHLEEYADQILELTIFELITMNFSERQKKAFILELLKVMGSLMGADQKISPEEMTFYNGLIKHFGLEDKNRTISKSLTQRHSPDLSHFHHQPSAKHFLIWMMFFLAKSDGAIDPLELNYIKEIAETLKINRTNFVMMSKFFLKETN